MLNHLDLCSGIGGFALGFEWAKLSKPIAFCDTDKFCQKVLAKNFKNIPIYNDVKEIANEPTRFIQEKVDILTSGYPCQPFSQSGKRKGLEDERHIFPYLLRIIEQVRPTYCVFENVYGHLSLGLDEVLFQMESIDYQTTTLVFPSSSIGAWHKRDRVWIIGKSLANTNCDNDLYEVAKSFREKEEVQKQYRKNNSSTWKSSRANDVRETSQVNVSNTNDKRLWSRFRGTDNDLQKESGERRDDRRGSFCNDERSNIETTKDEDLELSNTNGKGLQRRIIQSEMETIERQVVAKRSLEEQRTWWEVEHELCGVPHGISTELDKDRSNRLKALGNAICPQNAMYIGLAIKKDIMEGYKND